MMGQKKSLQRGFTIVEILIVVIVVGILAAITVVSFNASQRQAQDTRTISMVKSATQALNSYKTANGIYPASQESMDSGGNWEKSCLGDGYKDNNCGTTRLVGPCASVKDNFMNYSDGDPTEEDYEYYYNTYLNTEVKSSPLVIETLKKFINTDIPTIEHPAQSYSQSMGEDCQLVTTFTGPQYMTLCRVGIYNGEIYNTITGECGSTNSYQIVYFLSSKNANCSVPGSFDVTRWYDAEGDVTGTICATVHGERVTCSNEWCPEMWYN